MKQIVSNYIYSPTTNVVTLSGLNIDADQLLLIVAPQVGRTMYNFASVTGSVVAGVDTRVTLNASTAGLTTTSPLVIFYDDQASVQSVTGTVALDANSLAALESVTVTVGNVTIGSAVTIAGFSTSSLPPSTVTVGNTVTISGTVTATSLLNSTVENYDETVAPNVIAVHIKDTANNIFGVSPFPISGTVTVGNSVTIGSLPVSLSTTTIGGTARLNVTLSSATTLGAAVPSYGNLYGGSDGTNFRAINVDSSGRTVVTGSVSVGSLPAISGTVTVSGFASVSVGSGAILAAGSRNGTIVPLPLDSGSGNLAVQLKQSSGPSNDPISNTNPLWVTAVNTTVTVGSLPAISGTVTVGAMPSGALTTRFGSVTTANTAQLTSAVTNASRKYLLVQNIATSTVTIGIGFAPTTTQGIQLTAGAGLTFDAFCPTGGVWWLSGVTSSNFCVIEG